MFINEMQVGEHDVGLKFVVVFAGSPVAENETGCGVPAVITAVTP